MRSAKSVRWVVLALAGVLALLGLATVAQAGPSSPDFSLSIAPSSQSVPRGQTATYTVTVTSLDGWNGPVALTTSGGPTGTSLGSASLSPSPGSPATTTLTVPTTSSTALGSYGLTVDGAGARLKRSATAGLAVHQESSVALGLVPSSLSVPAGGSAAFTVGVTRTDDLGDLRLQVWGSLPPGVTGASFSPAVLRGTDSSSTLTVTSDPDAKARTGTLRVLASTADGSPSAFVDGEVVVRTVQSKPFTLGGRPIADLSPGISVPVDLEIANSNRSDLSVSNLTVRVHGTDRSTCSAADFSVRQYSGPYPLAVPARDSRSLSQLGVDPAHFPMLSMRNTAANQDGCKSASISLAYAGSAQGD